MIDLSIEEKVFESEILRFRVSMEDPSVSTLIEDAVLEMEGRKYAITRVIKDHDYSGAFLSVEADAIWTKLGDLSWAGNLVLTGVTPLAGLTSILTGSGWTIDQCTASVTTYSLEANDSNTLALLWEWAKICGCEVRFDTMAKTVDLNPSVGVNSQLSFRYNYNIQSVKRTAVAPKVTRLYVYGRYGLTIDGITGGYDYIEDYTFYTAQGITLGVAQANYRKDQIYRDDSFLSAQALYDAATLRLAELAQGSISYEVSVNDLATLTGYQSVANLRCADYVGVYDGVLSVDVTARVTRTKRYPLEPTKNEIELGFSTLTLPDSNVSVTRDNPAEEWVLFYSRNLLTPLKVRNGTTILHHLALETILGAQWVVTYSVQFTGVGAGTLLFEFYDETTSLPILPDRTVTFANGVQYELQWSYAAQDLAAATTAIRVRASSSGAAVGMDIANTESCLWVLAKGTVQTTITLPTSQVYLYTGAVQTFTVPADVSQITIACYGARGGHGTWGSTQGGGSGGYVEAKFSVVAGNTYDVYVGGRGENDSINALGGWPNGGNGGVGDGSNRGGGGGGASYVVPTAGALTAALIVAGGGGGHADTGNSRQATVGLGGAAGFYVGLDGSNSGGTCLGGGGATPTVGGIAGVGGVANGEAGDTDGTGQGGDGPTGSGAFIFPSGGGGGGWHGGGAGGHADFVGGGQFGAEGGGGSGYMLASSGYDLLFTDATNAEHGTITISWAAPI